MNVLCIKNGDNWCIVQPDGRMRDPRYTKVTQCEEQLVRIGSEVELQEREPDCPRCLRALKVEAKVSIVGDLLKVVGRDTEPVIWVTDDGKFHWNPKYTKEAACVLAWELVANQRAGWPNAACGIDQASAGPTKEFGEFPAFKPEFE